MDVKEKAVIFAAKSVTIDYLYKIFLNSGYKVIRHKDNPSIEEFRSKENIQIFISNDKSLNASK